MLRGNGRQLKHYIPGLARVRAASIFAGDPAIASAILDRLLHHSHIINIRGDSYRLNEKREAGLFDHSLPLKEGGENKE